MLGAIAGDIVGSRFEFAPIKSTEFELFAPGCAFTDDTVLTVALADAILNDLDYTDTLHRYGREYPRPLGGYGGRFGQWLRSGSREPYNSFGNGAAMRISPAGWAYSTLDEVLRHAERFTTVTHDHPEGIKGAQATAAAVFLARTGVTKAEIRDYAGTTFGYDLSRRVDAIRPTYRFDETCQGTVPEAILCFLESEGFEDSIRLAVSLGGDADTLAAITGGIAEAHYGMPQAIRAPTLHRLDDRLRTVVDHFQATFGGAQ